MIKIEKKYKCIFYILCVFVLFLNTINPVYAKDQQVELTGSYRHPYNGVIEDSGGENSFALGESMVKKIINNQAVYNTGESSKPSVSFNMYLMSNISDVSFKVQKKGESNWSSVQCKRQEIDKDTAKFTVPVSSSTDVIKAECYVVPMGRSVIFFISFKGDEITETGADKSDVNINSGSVQKDEDLSNTGLIIGGPDVKGQDTVNESDGQNLLSTEEVDGKQVIIDNSLWITLFMLLFSVVVISGGILIAIYYVVKNVLVERNTYLKVNESLFNDIKEQDDEDEVDFSDIELWGDECEEE